MTCRSSLSIPSSSFIRLVYFHHDSLPSKTALDYPGFLPLGIGIASGGAKPSSLWLASKLCPPIKGKRQTMPHRFTAQLVASEVGMLPHQFAVCYSICNSVLFSHFLLLLECLFSQQQCRRIVAALIRSYDCFSSNTHSVLVRSIVTSRSRC